MIKTTLNLDTGIFSDNINVRNKNIIVKIGFTGGTFNDLQFGFDVVKSGKTVYSVEYPPAGIVYISSDQLYITNDKVTILKPDDQYAVNFWVLNNSQEYTHQVTGKVPRPKAPKNWIWNSVLGIYEPPIPRPDDGNFYTWDEDLEDWVIFN